MKYLVFVFLFGFQVYAKGQVADAENPILSQSVEDIESSVNPSDQVHAEELFETVSEDSEAELMKFLIEEALPAFGGFQDLLFSKPSFDIHWTPQGVQVKNCFFEFQLKQLRAIKYNLADVALYGFYSNAEIGDARLLFVQTSCGATDETTGAIRFNIKFFVTDEDLTPSYYGLKITTMDKEQLNIKLKSIAMDVEIEPVDYTLVLDPYGHIEILPHTSSSLEFFEEDSAYSEETEENQGEEEVMKNMYDIPVSVWNQIRGINEESSDSVIPLKKVSVEQVIHLQGSAEMSLPVYVGGVKRDSDIVIPITGRIFSSAEGEMIPLIDISIK